MCAVRDLALPPLHQALRSAAQRDDQARYQQHLLAVLLVAQGHSCIEIGQWLDCSPRSIERWVQAYRDGGCAALQVLRRGGRPARLTPGQWMQLRDELTTPPAAQGYPQPDWCGKLLANHLSRHYGLELSLRHCQRLLHQARCEPS